MLIAAVADSPVSCYHSCLYNGTSFLPEICLGDLAGIMEGIETHWQLGSCWYPIGTWEGAGYLLVAGKPSEIKQGLDPLVNLLLL